MSDNKKYTVISPLGKRKSVGTFDDIFDSKKYRTHAEAFEANDLIVCDFVTDQEGTIYIQAHHIAKPDEKKYHLLNFQRFPFGVDALDDRLAVEMATTLFKE